MATTRASRNIGLRKFYDPLNPPAPAPTAPSGLFPPDPYGRTAAPVAYEPSGGEMPLVGNPQLGAMSPPEAAPSQGRVAEINVPLAPWDNHMPGPNSGPGGIGGDYRYPTQQVDERLLPASPSVAATPLPPARPPGLGQVLSSAVVPTPPPRPTNLGSGPPQATGPFIGGIDRQNSGPNDRFRGGGTALDLSGLLGGLFGRR